MDPILIPLYEDKLKAPVYHLVGSSWGRLWISQIKKKKFQGMALNRGNYWFACFPSIYQYMFVFTNQGPSIGVLYKLQWRPLNIHLELIAGSCRKINLIFFSTKKIIIYRHTVFPIPDVSGFMDMQFIPIDL